MTPGGNAENLPVQSHGNHVGGIDYSALLLAAHSSSNAQLRIRGRASTVWRRWWRPGV